MSRYNSVEMVGVTKQLCPWDWIWRIETKVSDGLRWRYPLLFVLNVGSHWYKKQKHGRVWKTFCGAKSATVHSKRINSSLPEGNFVFQPVATANGSTSQLTAKITFSFKHLHKRYKRFLRTWAMASWLNILCCNLKTSDRSLLYITAARFPPENLVSLVVGR